MKRILYLLICVVSFIACSDKTYNVGTEYLINLRENSNDVIFPLNIFEITDTIFLKSPITEKVTTIKRVIPYKNNYYILDQYFGNFLVNN